MSKDFFDDFKIKDIEVAKEQKIMIISKLNTILSYEIRIDIFGKIEIGKSNLSHALFGKAICTISTVEPCIRDPTKMTTT